MQPSDWVQRVVLPVGDVQPPPGARLFEAAADDGGALRVYHTRQGNGHHLQVAYIPRRECAECGGGGDPCEACGGSGWVESPGLRFPTFEELYSAMVALGLERGLMMGVPVQVPNAADLELLGEGSEATMFEVVQLASREQSIHLLS